MVRFGLFELVPRSSFVSVLNMIFITAFSINRFFPFFIDHEDMLLVFDWFVSDI